MVEGKARKVDLLCQLKEKTMHGKRNRVTMRYSSYLNLSVAKQHRHQTIFDNLSLALNIPLLCMHQLKLMTSILPKLKQLENAQRVIHFWTLFSKWVQIILPLIVCNQYQSLIDFSTCASEIRKWFWTKWRTYN